MKIDPITKKTSKRGVFTGGDIVTIGATVILAMRQAIITAHATNEYPQAGAF